MQISFLQLLNKGFRITIIKNILNKNESVEKGCAFPVVLVFYVFGL